MIETLGSLSGGFNPPVMTRDYQEPSAGPGASLENPRTSWDRIFQVQEGYAGKAVNEMVALQLTSVWRCVNLIASSSGVCPLNVYRRVPEIGKVKAEGHYLWPLLHLCANDQIRLSAYRFKRMMQTWVLLWGNAYAEFEENGRGQITRFWPMRPDRMRISGPPDNLVYTYTRPGGTPYTVPAAYMLHLRGLETDGVLGLSPIKTMQQTIGLGLAAEEYGARYFGSSGKPGGWIELQGKLSPEGKQNLRESFEDLHRGLRGAHRVAIFEEGTKYHEVGIPPEDMQFLQTRQFQGIDIARIFGVPPHMIAELSRATFSNIEHQSIEFVDHCLAPWFVNWEQELMVACLSTSEVQTVFLEFYRDALKRGDRLQRYSAYNIARNGGWMNADEIRDEESMNRLPDGKGQVYLQPLNMTPAADEPDTDPDKDPNDPGAGGEPAPPDPAAVKKAAKKAAKKLSGGSEQ